MSFAQLHQDHWGEGLDKEEDGCKYREVRVAKGRRLSLKSGDRDHWLEWV